MFLDVSYIPERWLAHEVKRDALFSGLQYQFASPVRPLKQTNKQTLFFRGNPIEKSEKSYDSGNFPTVDFFYLEV